MLWYFVWKAVIYLTGVLGILGLVFLVVGKVKNKLAFKKLGKVLLTITLISVLVNIVITYLILSNMEIIL